MSADQGSEVQAVPAAPAAQTPAPAPAAATEGPRIITVIGQEGYKAEPAPAAAAPETPTEQPQATGSEEKKTPPEGGEDGDPQDRDDKGRFKPGAQKRIDELTRKRHDAEREAAYWKGLATGAGAKPVDQVQAPAPAPKEAPVREKFATEAEYIDALVDHKVEQRAQQAEAQRKQAEEINTKATTWQQKVDAAKAAIPDYDEVLEANADMPVQPHVIDLLMEHDDGAKIVHFLASNPAALEKLNGMTPAKAAFELASIASKFQSAASAPESAAPGSTASAPAAEAAAPGASSKPAAERAVSKAPPPAASNVGAGRSTESRLEDLSMDDYVARRKAQGAGWANR